MVSRGGRFRPNARQGRHGSPLNRRSRCEISPKIETKNRKRDSRGCYTTCRARSFFPWSMPGRAGAGRGGDSRLWGAFEPRSRGAARCWNPGAGRPSNASGNSHGSFGFRADGAGGADAAGVCVIAGARARGSGGFGSGDRAAGAGFGGFSWRGRQADVAMRSMG